MRRRIGIAIATICLGVVACDHSEPVAINPLLTASDKSVVVNPSDVTLDIGGTQQLSAQLVRGDGQKKAAFTWSSSDTGVARVSATGLVTGVASGEATITATASRTQSGTAHVAVRQPPPQVIAHLPLFGLPTGSAVSSGGIGWIPQPQFGQVTRLDIAAATFTGSAPAGPWPVQISANGDGSRIYVTSFFGNGLVLSINTATLTTEYTANATPDQQDAYAVTSTPTGDTVFVGITNGPIFKVDLRSGTVLGRIDLPAAAATHFEWSRDRTRLYVSIRGFDGGHVFEVQPDSFTVLRTFETGGSPEGIQLSADGSKLFVAAQGQSKVLVWDIGSNSLAATYDTPGCGGFGLLRTPDNAFLLVGCVSDGLVEVLNPTTGALIETLNVGGTPREMSYDPATGRILVPNQDGWVDILR